MPPDNSVERNLSIASALLLALLGLGYVYVGRLRVALMFVVAGFALVAAFSWTRLILDVHATYVLVAMLITFALTQIIHPVVIAAREKRAATRPYNRWWFYALWLVMAALLWNLLTTSRGAIFGYGTFWIPAESMAPTLEQGDVIMMDAWRYRRSDPEAGEVVVFRLGTGTDYVKRVVGVPGDLLEIRDGVLYRNQQPVAEPYLHPLGHHLFGRDVPALRLGESEYYVLGDYRDNSRDSRSFGPIHRDRIRGRIEYIAFAYWDGALQWHRFPRYLEHGT